MLSAISSLIVLNLCPSLPRTLLVFFGRSVLMMARLPNDVKEDFSDNF
jgi:hypothetical protein